MVEREAACLEILATRMQEGSLDPCPVWTDARTFDGTAWRGAVDIVAAGYPCQPFSSAGNRKGENDPRHLWPEVARIAQESRPDVLFLENVQGHVRLGLREVLDDLASMGFNAEWGIYSAAQAGLPHRRNRLFILAYRDSDRCDGKRIRLREWQSQQDRSEATGKGTRSDCQAAGALGPNDDWSGTPKELWPATESDIHGVPDGLSNRVDRIRALGNAVVPQQAELAIKDLLSRIP